MGSTILFTHLKIIHTLLSTVHILFGTIYGLKNIKNGFYNTIHTFKNNFVTVISVFSFSNNKFNPNGPKELHASYAKGCPTAEELYRVRPSVIV